jgi:hypothetical protein
MIHHPGKTIRIGRLLDAESNRTVIVAIDHGLGGAASGIEHLEKALEKIIAGNPEAIIMSAGVAKRFQHLLCGKSKPSIIVTVDYGSGSTLPSKGSRGEDYRLIVNVEDALKIGADAMKMVLVFGREDVKIHADNIQAVATIASQCEQWRVPLLLEPVLWGKTVTPVRKERIPNTGIPKGYWEGAPDLAVEVISLGDTYVEVEDKVHDWITAGTSMVWVVNPQRRTVTVHHSLKDSTLLTEEDELNGGDVIEGFQCRVAEIFI